MAAVEITVVKPNVAGGCKTLNLKNPTAAAYLNGTLKPEDVILTKNGSVYVKKFKCRVCQYKAAWESEMIRHEVRVHGLEAASKKKPLPRPIPNLIPIQGGGNGSGGNSNGNSSNGGRKGSPGRNGRSSPSCSRFQSISSTSSPLASGFGEATMEVDNKPLTEKDLNDIYAKSCATSSLKDFASLIGTEETLKSERLKDFMSLFASEAAAAAAADKKGSPNEKSAATSASSSPSSASVSAAQDKGMRTPEACGSISSDSSGKKLPDSFKKKNATFFDRLKEKLMTGAGENGNLACWCGHKSKCLSESVIHQKTHSDSLNEKNGEKSVLNGPLISGAELSSTR